jgi:hypothetical protein
VVTRAALKDTRTPTIVTSIAMGLNLVFSLGFSLFSAVGWLPTGWPALRYLLGGHAVKAYGAAGGLGGRRALAALGQGGRLPPGWAGTAA